MPRGACVVREPMMLKSGSPMDWTRIVQELAGGEPSLELAFSAMCISSVGRDSQDQRLVQESKKMYGKALKDLQAALYSPERMYSDETLTACRFLGLYETFGSMPDRSFAWISHTEGAARLIELRGPERHVVRQPHYVFLGSRLPIIYASIVQRRATFLSSEEWLTIPWNKQLRTYHDRMVDILTQIPSLVQRMEEVESGTVEPDSEKPRIELVEDCATVLKTLHEWFNNAKPECLPFLRNHDAKVGDGYPYKVQQSFKNHLFAQTFTVYWSACVLLSETLQALLEGIELPTAHKDEWLSSEWLSQNADANIFATLIAQAIPYCLQADMGALGANLIIFPMAIAYRCFHRNKDTAACRWFEKSFVALQRKGLNVQKFVEAFLGGTVSSVWTDEWLPEFAAGAPQQQHLLLSSDPHSHAESSDESAESSASSHTSFGTEDPNWSTFK